MSTRSFATHAERLFWTRRAAAHAGATTAGDGVFTGPFPDPATKRERGPADTDGQVDRFEIEGEVDGFKLIRYRKCIVIDNFWAAQIPWKCPYLFGPFPNDTYSGVALGVGVEGVS